MKLSRRLVIFVYLLLLPVAHLSDAPGRRSCPKETPTKNPEDSVRLEPRPSGLRVGHVGLHYVFTVVKSSLRDNNIKNLTFQSFPKQTLVFTCLY